MVVGAPATHLQAILEAVDVAVELALARIFEAEDRWKQTHPQLPELYF